jgi:hypothetical protein
MRISYRASHCAPPSLAKPELCSRDRSLLFGRGGWPVARSSSSTLDPFPSLHRSRLLFFLATALPQPRCCHAISLLSRTIILFSLLFSPPLLLHTRRAGTLSHAARSPGAQDQRRQHHTQDPSPARRRRYEPRGLPVPPSLSCSPLPAPPISRRNLQCPFPPLFPARYHLSTLLARQSSSSALRGPASPLLPAPIYIESTAAPCALPHTHTRLPRLRPG